MKNLNYFGLILMIFSSESFAFDPYCMWGKNDILCESSRLAKGYLNLPSGQKIVNQLGSEFIKGLSRQNPYSVNYNSSKDICLVQSGCNLLKKQMAHVNWLHSQCTKYRKRKACRRLENGPYQSAGRINRFSGIPYHPGTQPYDPKASIRSGP